MYRLIIADDERIVLTGIKNTIDWLPWMWK